MGKDISQLTGIIKGLQLIQSIEPDATVRILNMNEIQCGSELSVTRMYLEQLSQMADYGWDFDDNDPSGWTTLV